jgi:opacity protein-like surface antigen
MFNRLSIKLFIFLIASFVAVVIGPPAANAQVKIYGTRALLYITFADDPSYEYQVFIDDKFIRSRAIQYLDNLIAARSACNREAYEHALLNLKALSEIAYKHVAPATLKNNENRAGYDDSVAMNQLFSWASSRQWPKKCYPHEEQHVHAGTDSHTASGYFTGYDVGISGGVLSFSTRFDDGFKMDSTTGAVGFNLGFRTPVNNLNIPLIGTGPAFIGLSAGGLIPFGETTDANTRTRVEAAYHISLLIGTDWRIPQVASPLTVYAGIGPAIGNVKISTIIPALSDTQTLTGVTVSTGVEIPLQGNMVLFNEARYIGLQPGTFSLGGGSFSARENIFSDQVGIRIKLP